MWQKGFFRDNQCIEIYGNKCLKTCVFQKPITTSIHLTVAHSKNMLPWTSVENLQTICQSGWLNSLIFISPILSLSLYHMNYINIMYLSSKGLDYEKSTSIVSWVLWFIRNCELPFSTTDSRSLILEA